MNSIIAIIEFFAVMTPIALVFHYLCYGIVLLMDREPKKKDKNKI